MYFHQQRWLLSICAIIVFILKALALQSVRHHMLVSMDLLATHSMAIIFAIACTATIINIQDGKAAAGEVLNLQVHVTGCLQCRPLVDFYK